MTPPKRENIFLSKLDALHKFCTYHSDKNAAEGERVTRTSQRHFQNHLMFSEVTILPSPSSTQLSQSVCPTCQHSQCHNVVQFCDFEDKVCSSTVVHSTRYAVQPIFISPAKIFIAWLFLQTLPKLKDFCPEMHDLRVFSTISFIQLEFGDRNHLGER